MSAKGVILPCLSAKVQGMTMEKQKRWQFYLILAVILLTVYNVFPTLFYYSKPLKKPIGEKEASQIAKQISQRVNSLETFTLSWLRAQSKNLGVKPLSIELSSADPKIAILKFPNEKQASLFAKSLVRAGSLIPFAPAQLIPDLRSLDQDPTLVIVQRKVGLHLDSLNEKRIFSYVPKKTEEGISVAYKQLIADRVSHIALHLAGKNPQASLISQLKRDELSNDETIKLARLIVDYENAFGDESQITQRFFATFSQGVDSSEKTTVANQLTARFETLSQLFSKRISSLREVQTQLKEKGEFLSTEQLQELQIFESQKNMINSAALIVRRNSASFQQGLPPVTTLQITEFLTKQKPSAIQTIDLGQRNPFVSKLLINWNQDQISLVLHEDVESLRAATPNSEMEAIAQEKASQLLFNAIAAAARASDEEITPSLDGFAIQLTRLKNSSSLLTIDLALVGMLQMETFEQYLNETWDKTSSEFKAENFPIELTNSIDQLEAKKFGLALYVPTADQKEHSGFRNGSLYAVARNLGSTLQSIRELPDSKEKNAFETEWRSIQEFFRQNGFIGYYATDSTLPLKFKNDYIFELDEYSSYLLAATREDFSSFGSKQFAALEFTDVEQRILTLNKIETAIHEDLIKWRDERQAALVSLTPQAKYDVPPPTKSVFWNNLALSAKKYFRGDERKIIKWGLDLSGGKTVRIGLKDQNGQPISNEADLKQAVNELYKRVNRLGVSEVGIRIEGSTIALDFPGSQGLTASDLIQASAMYFHVVNEKFSPQNPSLSEAINTFLEEVWNEALITNRTDSDSINEIAWEHLGGQIDQPEEFVPLTSHARLLYDSGLRLANPKQTSRSSALNESLSSIGILRGSNFSDWQGQTHPLVVIFHNYALEGSQLADVQTGYDQSEGNILYFTIKGSSFKKDGEKINPREDFYLWTSQFAEDKIAGTPKENYSRGRGWRMAVILNGTIISSPALTSALKDSARISGHFSQREVNQLAADLKAGSLSFSPYILAEENISPELGKEQRFQGIAAATLGLILVISVMCAYYRFGGLVASIAVLFNLLILWGVLQNLGAAITLPGIAGIILTVGMAVDANVLVFERIREEFAISGRLPSAVATGYKKAFSAIIDSNLTTIIAALILLNFDAGPIKGFALTLIIGIVSSMFTSLFMTRYFFAGWVQNPKHKLLKMSKLFGQTHFDFLKYSQRALVVTGLIVALGIGALAWKRHTVLGMDFTGGYALSIELAEKPDVPSYRLLVIQALENAGASPSDFQVRELSKPNYLRIQLSTGLQQQGKPFSMLSSESDQEALFPYQQYPQIVWIVDALQREDLMVEPAALPQLHLHWTEMSGQLSDSMRNNALIGLGIALICILIYISFRFEFKYAVSATIGLGHDLLVTLGILAMIHQFVGTVQIDLQVIAAFLTIVGYSLNDTIIIFDRIREDLKLMRKASFKEIINHALNATLSRTVMTSGTTLLVLLALVLFGGPSIFNFSLIMTIGVAVGTLSSMFIAAPLLLYFHKREVQKFEEASSLKKVGM